MIIGTVSKSISRGDDREIVLFVVRACVFTAAPLHQFLVVAHSHDRSPPSRPAAVALVVALARGRASIVLQSKRVADLVADRLGHILRGVEIFREDERGRVGTPVERPHVSDTTIRAIPRPISTDDDANSPSRVASPGVAQVIQRGCLSRHVRVERRKVLDDPLPDVLNVQQFGIREGTRVAIGVVRGSDDRAAAPVGVGMSVEVEIDRFRRRGPAAQLECLIEREDCSWRGFHDPHFQQIRRRQRAARTAA